MTTKAKEIVHEALGNVRADLDEVVLDYIIGIVADFNEQDETLVDVVSPYLEGVFDEAQIKTFCDDVMNILHGKGKKQKGPSKLKTAVNIGDMVKDPEEELRKLKIQQQYQEIVGRDTFSEFVNITKVDPKKKKKGLAQSSSAHNTTVFVKRRKAGQVSRQGLSRDVHLVKIEVSAGGRKLIQESNVSLIFGRKYGLVGRNGTGKSTLLRAISAREIEVPTHLDILHVEQEVIGDETTVIQSVLMCDIEREEMLVEEKRLLAEAEKATTEEAKKDIDAKLALIYTQMADLEIDKAEAAASTILAGLGFNSAMQQQTTKEFSGGWRMRISLAKALFCDPDLLLLDEPTNMLDVKTVLWLENYLTKWPKTLFVVSHDREFLNHVATDIVHLQAEILTTYKGNYDAFAKARLEKMMTQQKLHEAQDKQRAHVQKFIDRFRFNAKRASLVQSRIKMLSKIEVIPEVVEDPTLSFTFPSTEPLKSPVVQFQDVTFGYDPNKPLFKKLNFNINMESRVALIGANGMGKTTLLKVITEDLKPTSGYVVKSSRLRLAKFSQHHVEQLDLDLSPVQFLQRHYPGKDQQHYRSFLGRYGISADLALQRMDTLSGGQKSRVVFAFMAMMEPHVMVLDEPINHLDIETVDILAQALNDFEGGLVLVSHDERMINMVCDELWLVENGSVTEYPGDFNAYKEMCMKEFQSY
eukprot:TRINITY_DN2324_c0_g1_i1.p1 TRINITY_DN2324_c0_g1~~TRINITY_DN2324_c0_g1_i1.p1  ORF type:complete len:697 (-),score=231.17 TRINITY_DN2324_c0_g1_i1:12-2102(-)